MLNEIRYDTHSIWHPTLSFSLNMYLFFDIEPWVKCQYNIYDNYNVWAGPSLASFKSFIIHLCGYLCIYTCVCVFRDVCVLLVNAPLNVICMKHSHNVSVWPLPYQKHLMDEWTLQQCVCLCERVCVRASMAALQTWGPQTKDHSSSHSGNCEASLGDTGADAESGGSGVQQ